MASPRRYRPALTLVVFLLLVALISATGLLTPDNIDNWVIGLTLVGAIALFAVLLTSKRTTADEHSRVLSFVPLWLANVVFWALFQQQFTVIAVYSDTRLDWHLFGMELKPGLVNSINPIFIIAFGTLFSVMWTKLGERQPTTVTKWSFGLVGAGIAFLIFLTQAGKPLVSLWWIVLILFVLSAAFFQVEADAVGGALLVRKSISCCSRLNSGLVENRSSCRLRSSSIMPLKSK